MDNLGFTITQNQQNTINSTTITTDCLDATKGTVTTLTSTTAGITSGTVTTLTSTTAGITTANITNGNITTANIDNAIISDTGDIKMGTTSGGGDDVTYPSIIQTFEAGENVNTGNVVRLGSTGANDPAVFKITTTEALSELVLGTCVGPAVTGGDVDVFIGGTFIAQTDNSSGGVVIGDYVQPSTNGNGQVDTTSLNSSVFGVSLTDTGPSAFMTGMFLKNSGFDTNPTFTNVQIDNNFIIEDSGSIFLGGSSGGFDNATYPSISMDFLAGESIALGHVVKLIDDGAGNPEAHLMEATDTTKTGVLGVALTGVGAGSDVPVAVGGSFSALLETSLACNIGDRIRQSSSEDGRVEVCNFGEEGTFGICLENQTGGALEFVKCVFTRNSFSPFDPLFNEVTIENTGMVKLGTTAGGVDNVTYPCTTMLFTAAGTITVRDVVKMVDDGAGNPVVARMLTTDAGITGVVGTANQSATVGQEIEVCVGGSFRAVAGSAIVIGDVINRSTVTDGRVAPTIGSRGAFGISMSDALVGENLTGIFLKNESAT